AAAIPLALPRDRIAVNRGDTAVARVNPTLSQAYNALQAGQFDAAHSLYNDVLRGEPHNIDALLGLAAIAQQANRTDEAQRYFMAILNLEPRHALAQAGLLSTMSRADPLAAESRLKQLIAREPSAPLYFNLGNLYADQGQWAQAQQAYFQAHDLDPKNPDYAYNLAVGLEHLNQPKIALGYYRRALELASVRGSAHFDRARLQERITRLSARHD
ncbi:MAG: tetratricopeptide repeat protein, partial [Betaproteobacteria bacterium]|nr:tetratricopeptide repeat protein [Betaproteobacteria bacterium]